MVMHGAHGTIADSSAHMHPHAPKTRTATCTTSQVCVLMSMSSIVFRLGLGQHVLPRGQARARGG